ncbi:MAG: HepT-like ribonuclease domain-containing protein [Planctomycetota bacterium]
MQLETKKYLADALAAAEKVLRYTAGKTLDDYRSDDMLRSAVERQFVTIGEAMVRLRSQSLATFSRISDQRRIVRFRNIVVHGYDVLSHETVWDVVQQHVPILRTELRSLLAGST